MTPMINSHIQTCKCGHDIDTHFKENGKPMACLGRGCNTVPDDWEMKKVMEKFERYGKDMPHYHTRTNRCTEYFPQ